MRSSQSLLLLVAKPAIVSGCRRSRDLERYARRHREALNQTLERYVGAVLESELSLSVQ